MKYDEILSSIGEFGLYQKGILALLCFPSLSIGSFCMMLIAVLFTPNHRCKIPSLPNDTYAIQNPHHAQLVNETIPPSNDPTLVYDKCHIYNTTGISFDPDYQQANTSKTECNKWVYDQTVFTNTFTSQLNLVCGDSLKTSHIMMIFYLGFLVGDIILSMLSDSKGRKKTIYLAMFITLVTSISVTFAPEFYSFTILMFVVGGSAHGAFLAISVLCTEMVGPSKRLWAIMITQITVCSGGCYVAVAAFAGRSWTVLNLSCAIPCVIYLSYWWLIPESPRWLISKEREREAEVVIRKTAKVNKTQVPENMHITKGDIPRQPEGKLWHVFVSPILLRRTLILAFNWMIVSMTYYGVTLNSANMGGHFFLNFFLMGLVEIPGVILCMVILDKLGRRWSNAGTMILGGIACLATIPTVLLGGDELQPLIITLALIGKAAATAAFATIYMFTAELVPTIVRNSSMGTCSCAARVGAMIAPYIAKSGEMIGGNFGMIEPLVVFGALSILAGLLLLLLPETLNKKLPDTIAEGEQFGRITELTEMEVPLAKNL